MLSRGFAARLYALLLRAFSVEHRARYAQEMVDAFERERLQHARERGTWRAIRFVLAAYADAVRAGLTERRGNGRISSDDRERLGATWIRRPRAALGIPHGALLDVKLGLRLLAKNPALTLVACFALAIGIPIGLAPLQLLGALDAPPPFDGGDRIVGVREFDQSIGNEETRSLHSFETWQREVASIETMAALTTITRNLATEDGRVEPLRGSAVTASAFEILRVPPQLGRTLRADDQLPGAVPVVVLTDQLWKTHFASDPGVVGRHIRLGGVEHEVVGVMPPDFDFPRRVDRFWIPLEARAQDFEPRTGPSLVMFGRLRDGASAKEAASELERVGLRMAADFPETHRHLRPQVLSFTEAVTGLHSTPKTVITVETIALFILALVCGTVGTLMLARSMHRASELAVRTALGASRGRIIFQLSVEALVLATFSAAVGLGLAEIFLKQIEFAWNGMPSWFDLGLSVKTALRAGALAAFSALIAGVIPAIKATRRDVQKTLQGGANAKSGIRFGYASTALIVAQVAMGVACLSVVGVTARNAMRNPASELGVPAGEFVGTELSLALEAPSAASAAAFEEETRLRLAAIEEEVTRRLQAEPGVESVAIGSALPGMDHPRYLLEVEDLTVSDSALFRVRSASVEIGFFAGLGKQTISGRGFDERDLEGDVRTAIVNRSFVDEVLHGENPLGRRVRWAEIRTRPAGPWLEIVGVVDDLGMNSADPEFQAGIYEPAAPGALQPVRFAVHVATDAQLFGPRLREIVAQVDPTVIVKDPKTLDRILSEGVLELRLSSFAFGALAAVAIVLALAGLYALMSFTVSERTYEIAVRAALGAGPGQVVAKVLRKVMLQLLAGVVLGCILGSLLLTQLVNVSVTERWPFVVAAMALLMTAVGVLACGAPTLRALRIQPIEALRERA
jgi:putative ABC transport system permease protein